MDNDVVGRVTRFSQTAGWRRSVAGVLIGAATAAALARMLLGPVDAAVLVWAGFGGATAFALGDGVASQQPSWWRRALVYYATLAVASALVLPFKVALLPLLPMNRSPGPVVSGAAAVAVLGLLIALHRHAAAMAWLLHDEAPAGRARRWFYVLLGLLCLCGVGWLETTVPDGSFEFLYIVPVFAATWATGVWGGMAIAIIATNTYVLTGGAGVPGPSAGHVLLNVAVMAVALASGAVLLAALHRLLLNERRSARADALTGLLNAAAFMEVVTAETARARRGGKPYSLAYIDVDDFKKVNDAWGHSTGDRVLRCVAAVLRARLRDTDAAARLGGDEFGLLLIDTDEHSAHQMLTSLRENLLASMAEHGWNVTFSIGALAGIHATPSADVAISRADALMYDVKWSGKGAIRVERDTSCSVHRRGGDVPDRTIPTHR